MEEKKDKSIIITIIIAIVLCAIVIPVAWYFGGKIADKEKKQTNKNEIQEKANKVNEEIDRAMENAGKATFFYYMAALEDAAKLYVVANGTNGNVCMTVKSLTDSGFLAIKDITFDGVVKAVDNNGIYDYYITAYDKYYSVTNKQIADVDKEGKGFDTSRLTSIPQLDDCRYA